jgi:sialidase-1
VAGVGGAARRGQPPADAAATADHAAHRDRGRRGILRVCATAPHLSPHGDEVWWDFEDEVAVGARSCGPSALVPAALAVHWLPRAAAPRELVAPPARGDAAPPVFAPGDGGYAAFRIPAIVRAGDGALLAFAEGRLESISDACRTKDLVMRRSRDDGATWGRCSGWPPRPRTPPRSLMNPSPVVAGHGTGARVVLRLQPARRRRVGIAAGAGRATLRARLSDDHGAPGPTRSTSGAQLDLPEGSRGRLARRRGWRIQVGTLGHAIELRHGPHPGRLCCAGHGTFGAGSVFDSVAFLFWSDDRGETWRVGPALTRRDDGAPARGLNESTLAELPDGSLLVNSRHYRDGRPVGRRAVTA